ncbi:MAG TPA: alpha/beta fold hydrolase [Gemmatimonadales bacterium]|nr:alpha/beta fold hydrolase [Gemmatimonadales bacterium]
MSPTRIAGPTGTLALDDGGQGGGVPFVLVHSLAGTSGHWSHQLQHLRSSRRAVAFDFRAHGASEPARNRDYSIGGLAGDLGAVADGLGLGRFVLVGHSLGGGVALTYAGAHADRVAGLLLLDPIGDGTQIAAEQADSFLQALEADYDRVIQGYWSQIAGPNAAVKDRLLADLRATPREVVEQLFREVMRFDPRPALAGYRGPILSVVTPHNDEPFSLHRVGKGFPHRVVTDTGHWIQLDQPEAVNRILDEFLTGVNQQSG